MVQVLICSVGRPRYNGEQRGAGNLGTDYSEPGLVIQLFVFFAKVDQNTDYSGTLVFNLAEQTESRAKPLSTGATRKRQRRYRLHVHCIATIEMIDDYIDQVIYLNFILLNIFCDSEMIILTVRPT